MSSSSMSAGVDEASSGSLDDSYPEYACSPAHPALSSASEYPSPSSSVSRVSPPDDASGVVSAALRFSLILLTRSIPA